MLRLKYGLKSLIILRGGYCQRTHIKQNVFQGTQIVLITMRMGGRLSEAISDNIWISWANRQHNTDRDLSHAISKI